MIKKLEIKNQSFGCKIGPVVVFIIFFVLLLLQMQNVFLYFDDYAYMSLNYAYTVPDLNGTNFTAIQLMDFLRGHYEVWGGRILFFFFEIVSSHAGLWCIRLVQAVVTAGIFYMFYRIVTDHERFPKVFAAIIVCLAYGLIELKIATDGLYWFTASFLYLIPLLPIAFTGYFSFECLTGKSEPAAGKIIALALLAFMGAFSQEQLSAAFLILLGLIFLYDFLKTKTIDKHNVWMIAVIAAAAAGSVILFAAPGNQARIALNADYYGNPFLERVIPATEGLLNMLFSEQTYLFMLFFIPAFALMAVYMIGKEKRHNAFQYAVLVLSVLLFAVMVITGTGISLAFQSRKIRLSLMGIFTVLAIIQTVLYCRARKKPFLLLFFFVALAATGSAVVAPGISSRMILPFLLLMTPILAFAYIDLTCWLDNRLKEAGYRRPCAKYIFLAVFAVVTIFNAGTILKGYARNSNVNIENDRVMREGSGQIAQGNIPDIIILKQLPDERYTNQQPYFPNYDYIATWMKKYYGIPQDINIVYRAEEQ